jgi:hypothetical protein
VIEIGHHPLRPSRLHGCGGRLGRVTHERSDRCSGCEQCPRRRASLASGSPDDSDRTVYGHESGSLLSTDFNGYGQTFRHGLSCLQN